MSPRVLPKTDQLPHALYTCEQVRALDRLAIEHFEIPGLTLMRRAGAAAFELLRARWPQAKRIAVLCGPGNNGGDGYVLARLAQQAGLIVDVMAFGDMARLSADARNCLDDWQGAGGVLSESRQIGRGVEVVVDALLGTGLREAPRAEFAKAISQINQHPAPVLAIDVPSGVNADTGDAPGEAVHAACTLSFIGLKRGLFTGAAIDFVGEVFFDGLEVPAKLYASQILAARRIDLAKQQASLPRRARTAHKGHFGHVLVVGGDAGYGGAALLAAEAAARSGAGLVSVATRGAHVPGLLAARPELMVHDCDHSQPLPGLLQQASVLVIGPGLGQKAWGRELFDVAADGGRPAIIDADGLNLLADQPERAQPNWVLTPHPGEAARLLNVCVAEVQADRFAAVEALQKRFGCCVVLKGPGSLVFAGGKQPPAVCDAGNPGMASGGMGDVLSGVIAALMAQGLSPAEAAELGVCVHAAAADSAAAAHGERGLLAGDLMPYLREGVNR